MLQDMYWLCLNKIAVSLAVLRVGLASPRFMCRLVIVMPNVFSGVHAAQRLHSIHIISSGAWLWSLRYDDIVPFFNSFRRQSKVEAARGWSRLRCCSTGSELFRIRRSVRYVALAVGSVVRVEGWEQHAEQSLGSWRTSGDNVDGWFGNGNDDTNVPGPIQVGGCEAVVVYNESTD